MVVARVLVLVEVGADRSTAVVISSAVGGEVDDEAVMVCALEAVGAS